MSPPNPRESANALIFNPDCQMLYLAMRHSTNPALRNEPYRIAPEKLGLLLGGILFVLSLPAVIFAFKTMGPGETVELHGLITAKFTQSFPGPAWIFIAYPFFNGLMGNILGFPLALLFNLFAGMFAGLFDWLRK